MKKCVILLASLFLLFLYSCEKSEEAPVKEYELVDIQFILTGEAEKVDVEFQGAHVRNATTEPAFYSGVKEETVDEKSVFTMYQPLAKEIASRKDIYVEVPDIMGEEFPEKVLFGSAPQYIKRVFKYEDKNTKVPPNCDYLVTCLIHGYEQSAEFTATFKEIHSNEVVEIKGEWNGILYPHMESKSVFTKLE